MLYSIRNVFAMKALSTLLLLVWSCISTLVVASPNTGYTTIIGNDQLDSQVSRAFLACVNNIGIEYNIYVDEDGSTVVVPAEHRAVDELGEDQELFRCIVNTQSRMRVATESTIYYQDEHERAVSSKSVTHEWLIERGALGQKPIGTVPRSATSKQAACDPGSVHVYLGHDTEHYWAYLSDANKESVNNAANGVYTLMVATVGLQSSAFQNGLSLKM